MQKPPVPCKVLLVHSGVCNPPAPPPGRAQGNREQIGDLLLVPLPPLAGPRGEGTDWRPFARALPLAGPTGEGTDWRPVACAPPPSGRAQGEGTDWRPVA
eukprot:15461558-Alexandrium_andersonii.AAC.1